MDIIIPVYNSLQHAHSCITSILATKRAGDTLIVVDDGSHPSVAARLDGLLTERSDARMLRNPENVGYLRSIMRAQKESTDDLLLFLNSDTIMLPGTLDELEATILSDSRIGIVNPVSNWANWTRVPFPRGQSILSMQANLRRLAHPPFDVHNASGFCMLVRRSCLEACGGFDIAYDPGYWEETDLCMRATELGYRVVCNPACFVPHHGWASFGEAERNQRMETNRVLFEQRWGTKFGQLETWYRTERPLSSLDQRIESLGPSESNLASAPQGPTVLYLLNGLKLYGGVISVLQLVNQLVLNGVEANIAAFGEVDESVLRSMPMYVRPMVFDSEDALVREIPKVDIVVATHWSTAYTASRIESQGKCRRTVYFCQDYEPDFYPENSSERVLARASYELIDHKICKTPWLKRRLSAFGSSIEVIPLGLNTDEFIDYGSEREFDLISMARPDSERRNWQGTRKVYEQLLQQRPSLRLAVYGFGLDGATLPPSVENLGMLRGSSAVADALNRSRILLDASYFQGFGRPGLEAMACGTAAVLTRNGGITSYARHGVNCILIDPFDEAEISTRILALLDDPSLLQNLVREGRNTAEQFSWRVEGRRTAEFFRQLSGVR